MESSRFDTVTKLFANRTLSRRQALTQSGAGLVAGTLATAVGTIPSSEHDGFCYRWLHAACLPCKPWTDDWLALALYWGRRCNQKFSRCEGDCTPQHLCSVAWNCWA